MKSIVEKNATQFVANRDAVKSVYKFDGGLQLLSAASLFLSKDVEVDTEKLAACKEQIKKKVNGFSAIRGGLVSTVAAYLALAENPEEMLDKIQVAYKALKKVFTGCDYVVLAAAIMAQNAEKEQFDELVERTKTAYKLMKKDHPLLTGTDDSIACVAFAMSGRDISELVMETEAAYVLLKKRFKSSNAVQGLAQILAMCNGSVEQKVEKTIALYDLFREKKTKYGNSYQLASLGLLAQLEASKEGVVDEIIEAEAWLKAQKGFSTWSNVDKQTRLMYAAMLVQKQYENTEILQQIATQTIIGILIAEQAAMTAVIVCSVATTTAD